MIPTARISVQTILRLTLLHGIPRQRRKGGCRYRRTSCPDVTSIPYDVRAGMWQEKDVGVV